MTTRINRPLDAETKAGMDNEAYLEERPDGVLLHVVVQPRASRNQIVGMQQNALRVRLTAPPIEGAANKECIKYFAGVLNIAPSRLQLVRGHKSRHKTILILGRSHQEVSAALRLHGS